MAMLVRLNAADQAALLALAEAGGISPNELARRVLHDHLRRLGRRGQLPIGAEDQAAG